MEQEFFHLPALAFPRLTASVSDPLSSRLERVRARLNDYDFVATRY